MDSQCHAPTIGASALRYFLRALWIDYVQTGALVGATLFAGLTYRYALRQGQSRRREQRLAEVGNAVSGVAQAAVIRMEVEGQNVTFVTSQVYLESMIALSSENLPACAALTRMSAPEVRADDDRAVRDAFSEISEKLKTAA